LIISQQDSFPICNDEGKAVGVVELFNYSPLNDRAELGIEIEPEWQGKGLGKRSVLKMLRYAKEELALHTLYAIVEEDNIPSLSLFRNLGFEEQTIRNWFREGEKYKNGKLLQYTL
jgi:diamine N-acetyltransferase